MQSLLCVWCGGIINIMDILSHAIMGKILATKKVSDKKESRKIMYTGIFFSLLPDLAQIPLYLVVGYFAGRSFWFPQIIDWVGFRAAHPMWTMLWEIPHSVFFLILIIIPIVIWFKLPRIAIVAYGFHIFIDLFSHTGEWAVKPLYPFNFTIPGFTDGWAWPWWGMIISWIVLLLISLIISKIYASSASRTS